MANLLNTGGALCSTPQSLADAHYQSAVDILRQLEHESTENTLHDYLPGHCIGLSLQPTILNNEK